MKKLLLFIAAAATAVSSFAGGETVMREHRAIWFSPMLGSTWPGATVSASNETSLKRSLHTRLEKLRTHGINTLYFHVRAHCDATYESSYEPYASSVAGTRGGTVAFDPFAYFVECAHEHGIEVYAWVNPYRYSQGGSYGGGELNYENSHPEWLLSSSSQKILNPALPEVRQRIVDVCSEVATKYDIDGMIFDDYFYHSSIGMDADKDLYNAYKAAGGKSSQAQWRRDNVNMMVQSVREAVIAARPYAVFSIGPAGRISPDNISTYGLEAGPYGDMNYTGLYADPIYWLSQGWLDFLSPQVYWHSYFDKLTEWYSIAVPHFNRHLYTSVDCSRLNNNSSEYVRQIEFMRSHVRPNESGVVFFDYGAYINYREKYNDKNTQFGDILRAETFAYDALSPIHHWRTNAADYEVGAVVHNGSTLSWTAPSGAGPEARRYALYAIPAAMAATDFAFQPEYFVTAVYGESYEIPADGTASKYAVAVYDRYSNLHTARFEGTATLAAGTAPTALSPASGNAPDLFSLRWTHAPNARYQVEISETPDFATFKGVAETLTDEIPAINVADLKEGSTYYWRVKAYQPDHKMAVSEVASFTSTRMAITAPEVGTTDATLTPTISWTPADQGAVYTVDLATDKDFSSMVYSAETSQSSLTVPDMILVTGKKYFVRVKAALNGAASTTPTVQFATADRNDYTAPSILTPATDGLTLHIDESIELAPWTGMTYAYIEISADSSFPVRSTFKQTLTDFGTTSKVMGEVRISSKNLVAGTIYYVRVRGGYNLQSSAGINYTGYSPVRSFVYSDQAGIFAPETGGETYVDQAGILHLAAVSPVSVYDLAGRLVLTDAGCTELSLSGLASGAYIIRTNSVTFKWIK